MLDQLFFFLPCFLSFLDGITNAARAVTVTGLCCGEGCGDVVVASAPLLVTFKSDYVGATTASAMVILVTI